MEKGEFLRFFSKICSNGTVRAGLCVNKANKKASSIFKVRTRKDGNDDCLIV